jgi:hypothetical protein
MLCEVALFGELRLPDVAVETFLSSPVRSLALPGWPDTETAERSAEVVLEDLRGQALAPPEWLDITLEGCVLKVRAVLSKDTFLSIAPELNGLAGTAATFGSGGTLLTVGLGALTFGYSLRCAWGHATLRPLSTNAVRELVRSPAVTSMLDCARGPLEALLGEGAGAPFLAAP